MTFLKCMHQELKNFTVNTKFYHFSQTMDSCFNCYTVCLVPSIPAHICFNTFILWVKWNSQSVKITGEVSGEDCWIIPLNYFHNRLPLSFLWLTWIVPSLTLLHVKFNMHYNISEAWLTLWNRVLLGKPTVTQLVKKFPTFWETWKFTTIFTTAHYWTIS
jgi:hypothetical protein